MATTEEIKPYQNESTAKKQQVASMFDTISGTYDFLNHLMSLGIDRLWRKKAISLLKKDRPQLLLDVATGTGDFAIEAIRQLNPKKIIGVDISKGMLEEAQKKIAKKELGHQYEVQLGDSEKLPFGDEKFDAVTVAFGVRNFENLEKGLADIWRVTKSGGKVVVLEFSKPKVFPVRQLYHFYFHQITPFIGKLFSKDRRAYEYLPESVERFPDGAEFTNLLEKIGFRETICRPQLFGICTIYAATK